jgi:hypothetical protein
MDYVRGLCALGLMLVSGCAIIAGLDHTYERDDAEGEVDPEPSDAPTFECEAIGPYLDKKCANAGCHGAMMPAANLDLVSPGVEGRIADKSAMCGGLLVNTNDPQASLVYTKLLDQPPCGGRMPFLQEALPSEEIDCILTWIEGIEPSGMVKATITSFAALYMDCKLTPEGTPANSLKGSFDANYDNTSGDTPALPKVVGAKLNRGVGSWSFTVTPESTVVPAGGSPVVKHAVAVAVAAGSWLSSGEPCDYCAGDWTLDVTWDVDGQGMLNDIAGPLPVICSQ